MSRLIRRPITVTLDPSDTPIVFADADYTHRIAHIIDRWRESGRWWLGEPHRTVYRVLTVDDYVYDIECAADAWAICRVWD